MKPSFSLLELIFVIVIIGILAGVAIPRMFSGVDDAKIAKVKSDVATIRSAIATRYGKNVMAGDDNCPNLEINPNDNKLFEGVLSYPIKKNGSVKWDGNGTGYNVTIDNKVIRFKYLNSPDDACKFNCISNCNLIDE